MWQVLAFMVIGIMALQARLPVASIDEFITAEMPVAGAPGLAWAMVDDGEIYAAERGEVLAGSGRAVTPETPFKLGSISKSFTAMAVMQLVEAGQVDLDTEIAAYLEMFAGRPAGVITIRQLLSHTSGLSTLQGNDTHTDRTGDADELTRQVARIARWTPAHEPGSQWDYSNANHLVLGALIEAVSGRSYADYIEAEILAPIGMAHSFVADGESHGEIAVGHQPWFGTKRPFTARSTQRVTAPAGGIIGSASDVARYMAVIMNGEDDIISAASKAAMLRPASAASPRYGFGWVIDDTDGTAYHAGTSPGVETLAVLHPAEQKGVVVLINTGSGMGFGETSNLLTGVSARALGIDWPRDQSQRGRQLLYLTFLLLPLLFVGGIIVAWLRRAGLRSKSGPSGVFSLWFPLLMTGALGIAAVYVIPRLFGVSLQTLNLYQPDAVLLLTATAITGIAWAVFRLGIYYIGR